MVGDNLTIALLANDRCDEFRNRVKILSFICTFEKIDENSNSRKSVMKGSRRLLYFKVAPALCYNFGHLVRN